MIDATGPRNLLGMYSMLSNSAMIRAKAGKIDDNKHFGESQRKKKY